MKKEKLKITKFSGNVYTNRGFPPEEAAILAMRSELMCRLEILIRDKQWTQPGGHGFIVPTRINAINSAWAQKTCPPFYRARRTL